MQLPFDTLMPLEASAPEPQPDVDALVKHKAPEGPAGGKKTGAPVLCLPPFQLNAEGSFAMGPTSACPAWMLLQELCQHSGTRGLNVELELEIPTW